VTDPYPSHRRIEEIRDYLDNVAMQGEASGLTRELKQQWVHEALENVRYESLPREERGLMRQYLQKAAGYSRAQVERHIAQYRQLHAMPAIPVATRHALPKGWTIAALTTSALLAFALYRGSFALTGAVVTPRQAASSVASRQPVPRPPFAAPEEQASSSQESSSASSEAPAALPVEQAPQVPIPVLQETGGPLTFETVP
jgi:hypothetical protein